MMYVEFANKPTMFHMKHFVNVLHETSHPIKNMYIKGDKNMSKIFKASNKNGQRVYAMYQSDEGRYLWDVYTSWSKDKKQAYDKCRTKWFETECYNYDFHICSHNSYTFTVAWSGYYNGDRAIFVETATNSYIVLLDK